MLISVAVFGESKRISYQFPDLPIIIQSFLSYLYVVHI